MSSGEILLRKLFVDKDRRGRPVPRLGTVLYLLVVLDREVPPSNDGHAESGKIIRANLVHVGLGMLARLRRCEALDRHATVPFVVFENAHGSQPNRLNAGNRAERVRQLRIEDFHTFRSIAAQRRIDIESHEFLRGKAGAEIAQVRKTANKKPGSYQEQKGERHLRDDQRLSQAMLAAAQDRPGLILERSCDIRLGGLEG